MVLQERIELSTSPLLRECSTTELLQRRVGCGEPRATWRVNSRVQGRVQVQTGPFFRHNLDPRQRLV